MTRPLKLAGVPGSPYSRKMRALMRFRRVPFEWLQTMGGAPPNMPKAPLPLIPILYLPTDSGYEVLSDSTFQLRRLEALHKGRSVIPTDPVIALLDYLIEDYADEWVTKMMFHYRWAIEENVDNACKVLPRWMPAVPESFAQKFRASFGQRQIDRLTVVGSNATTGPLIEASYARLLAILEEHLQTHSFVMGKRPGSADFGLFGQLSQLVQVEPTSQAQARAESPRVLPWTETIEDVSGLEVGDDDWVARDALPPTFVALVNEIGRGYAPYMVANAAALDAGADQVECTVDGEPWVQQTFPYQRKCVAWLREAHQALGADDRRDFDQLIAGSGCEVLFS